MKSCIKTNSTLTSALKILHVAKQLKEDITSGDATQKERTKKSRKCWVRDMSPRNEKREIHG